MKDSEQMIVELYDALIGKPGHIGALEEFRTSLTALGVRTTRLERREQAHLMYHEKQDQDRQEGSRDLRRLMYGLVERAVVAVVGGAVALYVAIQTFLQPPGPPGK